LVCSGWETALRCESLTVQRGGTITLGAPFNDKADVSRILIHCSGTVTIEAGGAITADGRGYAGGIGNARDDDASSAGHGPGGGGFPAVWGASAGGSHGGQGGAPAAVETYGDPKAPLEPGSGGGGGNGIGGGAGGGAIRITAKSVVVDGTVSANGGDG